MLQMGGRDESVRSSTAATVAELKLLSHVRTLPDVAVVIHGGDAVAESKPGPTEMRHLLSGGHPRRRRGGRIEAAFGDVAAVASSLSSTAATLWPN